MSGPPTRVSGPASYWLARLPAQRDINDDKDKAGKVVKCAGDSDSSVTAHTFSEKFDGYLFGEKKEMTWKKPKTGCIGGTVYYCDKCDKMVCEFCYTHAQNMIEKKKKEAKRSRR